MKKRKNKINIILLILLCLYLLSSCYLPGLGESQSSDGIIITGGNTSERQIISEISAQMIKHYMPEEEVTIINNLGSSVLAVQAIERGEANIASVMYTGTSLTGELGLASTTNPNEAMCMVKQGYLEKYDAKWLNSFGFENTYAFMITRKLSEELGITKVSQLEKYAAELDAGVDMSWIERDGDGYRDFLKIYDFDFKKIYPMEISLVYNALDSGKMDVVLGYTTDGRIDTFDLIVLEDDKHLFPPYDACPVLTNSILEDYPELENIYGKLIGQIDTLTMQKLNRQSDEELIEPYNVARIFLEENNYFENVDAVSIY